jgi:hypothetical protein
MCPGVSSTWKTLADVLQLQILLLSVAASQHLTASCSETSDLTSLIQTNLHHVTRKDSARTAPTDHDRLQQRGAYNLSEKVAPVQASTPESVKLVQLFGNQGQLMVVAGGRSAQSHERALTFVTVLDPFWTTNLGRSSIWKNRESLPHEWILITNGKQVGLSALYAQAHKEAKNDLVVFVHPDVFLPADFYENFVEKLSKIESRDPDWGVLGTAGVSLDWTPESGADRIASCITDHHGITYKTGVDSLPVQALDEALLVLKRNSSIAFDTKLPNFDMYGSDVVMNARKAGKTSYLLNLPIRHKLVDPKGEPFDDRHFTQKINTEEYQDKWIESLMYLRGKWCQSGLESLGLMPLHATSISLYCP